MTIGMNFLQTLRRRYFYIAELQPDPQVLQAEEP